MHNQPDITPSQKDRPELLIQGPHLGQASLCEPILRALPQWFGIEAAIRQYRNDINTLPTFMAVVREKPIGFLTVKQHNRFAAEIYVMGISPNFHRQGIGRNLAQHCEKYLRRRGVEYLQVKTLSDSAPSASYAQTRAFYLALGFKPLEEIIQIWGEQNPCLLMIKYLFPTN